MGRDAGGHGHNAGEPGNPNHGKNGEFSGGGGDSGSGGGERRAIQQAKKTKEAAKYKEAKAEDKTFDKTRGAERRAADKEDRARDRAAARGDHQRAQSANAGHGHPITMHDGQKSVGTHASGSGGVSGSGGGAGIGAKLSSLAKGKPIKTASLRQSAKENVARGLMIDSTHFPTGQITQPVVSGYRRGRH